MIIENSIKVKEYKCFGEEEQGFEKILPINIIIGRNNSGKSSLIDLINNVINPNQGLTNIPTKETGFGKAIISDVITEQYIEAVFPRGTSGGGIPGQSHYHYGLTLKDSIIKYTIPPTQLKEILSMEKPIVGQENYLTRLRDVLKNPFHGKIFKRINAERDILPERFYLSEPLTENGKGATNIIWKYLTIRGFDHNIIKKEFLNQLNKIINPDIEFTDITVKEDHPDSSNRQISNGEIYFEEKTGLSIPLSKMGSGIKTIILVLLNLIVIPKHDNIQKGNLVFGFEELENNLHPSLQRRLFNYIAEYAEQFKSYFFITTHSSIAIDFFHSNKNAQIIHVENNGQIATAKTVLTDFDNRNILRDLDYRASDILLSNGIIWVEGPSDAIYLELLFDLYNATSLISQNLSYTIQALSTAIWKYAGFSDFKWEEIDANSENRLISLAEINHNHLVVIDKDDNYENKRPSDYENFADGTGKNKARLIYESLKFASHDENKLDNNYGDTKDGKLFFWINDGTFETYLEYFILNKGRDLGKYFDLAKTRGYFEKKREGEHHSKSKVELAAEIAKYAMENKLTFEDFAPPNSPLENKIQRLFETIKSWN